MIGVSRALKSHVSRSSDGLQSRGFHWYIHTPQKDHMWAEDWTTAISIGNQYARQAQTETLRNA